MFLGKNEIKFSTAAVEGRFVEIENNKFYKISNFNRISDFFMTLVSDSNHWMYLSNNGSISFSPSLLIASEILPEAATFGYFNLDGEYKLLELKPGQVGFTFCHVPVVYSFASQQKILVKYSNGNNDELPGNKLSPEISTWIFSRSKEIEQIHVDFKR